MIRTDDIFLGAFLLVRGGGELVSVEVRGINGRRLAFFQIEGPEVDAAEREFFGGKASVDPVRLKFQVRRLKDRAFDAIREASREASGEEERRGHAALEQGRDRATDRGEPVRRIRR